MLIGFKSAFRQNALPARHILDKLQPDERQELVVLDGVGHVNRISAKHAHLAAPYIQLYVFNG